jgi:hypothetical protein
MDAKRSRGLLVALLAGGFVLSLVLGARLGERPAAKHQSLAYLPTPRFSRALFPGQGGFGASVFWSTTVLYYADVLLGDEDPRFLADLVNTVIALDPDWRYPYEFGGLVIVDSTGRRPSQEAVRILEKGVARFPDSWKLRVYLVHQLGEADLGLDSVRYADSASKVLAPLLTRRTADMPPYLQAYAVTMIHRSGRPGEAMSALCRTYRLIGDPMVQLQLQKNMARTLAPLIPRLGLRDSLELVAAVAPLLRSKDAGESQGIERMLVDLSVDSTRERAVPAARSVLGQYRAFVARD